MNVKKKKTEEEPISEPREMVGWRLAPDLIERVNNVAHGLPAVVPGTRASAASVVESILRGDTTLAELERRVAKAS